MTPKEKAIELFNKISIYMPFYYQWDNRKQCALIAVDEIINELIGHDFSRNAIVFWTSVKQEIEKL